MSRKRIATIAMALLLACGILPAAQGARGWEPLKLERTETKLITRDSETEVRTSPGMIIVTVSHQTPIKIFTILGRLVNSETLNAGSRQFAVPAHGVYIVKVGDLTCKVAV